MRRSTWAPAVAATLLGMGLLSGCGQLHDARKAATTTSPSPVVTAVGSTPPTAPPTNPGQSSQSVQSKGLAAVNQDLQSVRAATSQVDQDLAAGDSARAQDDN